MDALEIHVTEKDIRKAKKACKHGYPSCGVCPIAQALIREQYVLFPKVTYNTIWISGKTFRTTQRMKKFINKFDSGLKVKPQNFRVKDTIPF